MNSQPSDSKQIIIDKAAHHSRWLSGRLQAREGLREELLASLQDAWTVAAMQAGIAGPTANPSSPPADLGMALRRLRERVMARLIVRDLGLERDDLLVTGEGDLDLDPPTLVMQVDRHQGITGTFHLADQLAYFIGVEKQFARAHGVRLDVRGRGRQGTDVSPDEVELAVADVHVAVGQLDLAGADGLDLPALQHEPGFMVFFEVVLEAGAAVFCNRGHESGAYNRRIV